MTPNKIVNAYRAVRELSGAILPYRAARGVFALQKRLAEEFEAIAEIERKIVTEHGGKADENGKYTFPDVDKMKAFRDRYNAMMEEQADVEFPVVDLSECTDALHLSPASIAA